MICDAYPKKKSRLAELMLYSVAEERKILLGEFYHEPKYTKDIRCDLHPRWLRYGSAVTFDSVHGRSISQMCRRSCQRDEVCRGSPTPLRSLPGGG